MNTQLKQRIDEKLEHLSDQRVAEVLDFVEFLESRERTASAAQSEIHDNQTYLLSVEKTLNEWSSEADDRAYRDQLLGL